MPPCARRQFLIFIGAFIASACSPPQPSFSSDPSTEFPIPAEIEQFWETNGGLTTFGPPLGPAERDGALLRQTFLNVEFIHNPATGQVALAPIGRLLGLAEPAVPIDENQALYFDRTGHNLYPSFLQRYEELGGEAVLGAPIAEFSVEQGRILQYFENAGLFRDADSAPLAVDMMALGFALRSDNSTESRADFSIVQPQDVVTRPFGIFLETIGGEAVVGPPLGNPYLTEDGTLEQVYERAVLFSTLDDPQLVQFRPLGAAEFQLQAPTEPATEPDSMYFSNTGHNVRWAFAVFYRVHSGEALLGDPLEEAYLDGDQLIQTFENGVLVYRYDLPPQFAVQLAPLGRDYSFQVAIIPQPTPSPLPPTATAAPPSPEAIYLVEANVDQVVLPVSENQALVISVRDQHGQPVVAAEPIILVQSPAEDMYLVAPQTDENGVARIEFPLESISPGEIINFEVALADEGGIGFASGQFIGAIPAQP